MVDFWPFSAVFFLILLDISAASRLLLLTLPRFCYLAANPSAHSSIGMPVRHLLTPGADVLRHSNLAKINR